MEKLLEVISSQRPHLSQSSKKTYLSVLQRVFKKAFPDEKQMDHTLFSKHQEEVIKALEDIPFNSRKTLLAALVIITTEGVQKKYQDLMNKDAMKYNIEQKENKMTPLQKQNWISWDDVESTLEKLKRSTEHIWKESKPSRDDIMALQKYIILACYVMIPPRRLLDYTLMKIRGYNRAKDNFFDKGTFYFRQYKTAKFLGLQIEKLPKKLSQLITKWANFTGWPQLFQSYTGDDLTAALLTKTLNSIFFPKVISVNMLRHIYITTKSAPLINQLEQTAAEMGHSSAQAKLYVKK
jgi:hypothetical protein